MTIGTADTGSAAFNIVSGATIVTTAEKIKTRTVTGAGNITVTSIDAGNKDQDLSSISAASELFLYNIVQVVILHFQEDSLNLPLHFQVDKL